MTLQRLACNCKCNAESSGNCGEYTNCATQLKLTYAFPSFTAKAEYGTTVGTSTASVSAYSGNLQMFTSDACILNTCLYQGIKSDNCAEEIRCHTEAGFQEPTNLAVNCWHGDIYEDIKVEGYEEPQPNIFFQPPPVRFWNNCDCVTQSTADGFYSAEIKPAYLRHETRSENYWCQCSLNCGNASADNYGGLCSDCYSGYHKLMYRGAVNRMTFAKLLYVGNTPHCYGDDGFPNPVNQTLDQNRWYIAIGTQIGTGAVSRQRNCQGNWGSFQYYVGCPQTTDCTSCRVNDRGESWKCSGFNDYRDFMCSGTDAQFCDPSTRSLYELASIWALPTSIQDCKDLVGVTSSTSGVALARRYCPISNGAYGADARNIGSTPSAITYSESGFECSSWSIGDA
ncbi:MAG: hypothetical protein CL524_08320 [Aequorivita sp.]|nr:hypothetical protein [Aequorivita sp.]|tara:strand:+ start:4756 stop:5946 length:1191 start_codon:yes stop_codon:yes gene_type:complete